MSVRIASSLGIIREVLSENHPNAVIKAAEGGDCDYRISTVGATISVRAYDGREVTQQDIEEILLRGEEALEDRQIELSKNRSSNDVTWFELHR